METKVDRMAHNYAAAGLINQYSKSPILPQFNDRYVMPIRSRKPSNGDLASSGSSNSPKANSGNKMRTVMPRRSFMMTTAAAAERILAAQRRDIDTVAGLPTPPSSVLSQTEAELAAEIASNAVSAAAINMSSERPESSTGTDISSAMPLLNSIRDIPSRPKVPVNSFCSTKTTSETEKGDEGDDLSSSLAIQMARPSKSFAIRSIDLLMMQNPTIDIELKLLKKAIQDHEEGVEHSKSVLEAEMHKKLWEFSVKVEKLEKRLEGKSTIVNDAYDILDDYEDQLEKSKNRLKESKQRIHDLENEMAKKEMALELEKRKRSDVTVRLEREKRGLIEQLAMLEQKIDIATIRADTTYQTKELALRHNESMKRHYSFYRDYFDKQDALYQNYFGKHNQTNETMMSSHGRSSSIKLIEDSFAGDPAGIGDELSRDKSIRSIRTFDSFPRFNENITVEIIRPRLNATSCDYLFSVECATDTLRQRYRNGLAEKNEDQELVRGFEFLAWLENGFDGKASLNSSPSFNDTSFESDDVKKEKVHGVESAPSFRSV